MVYAFSPVIGFIPIQRWATKRIITVYHWGLSLLDCLSMYTYLLQIPPTIEDENVYVDIKQALQEIGLAKDTTS